MEHQKTIYSRRDFIKKNSMAGAGAVISMGLAPSLLNGFNGIQDTPAILNGTAVRTAGWPEWPQWHPESDEDRLLEVVRSGVWSRAGTVTEFEEAWAETVGAKRCLTTVNGTNALICSLANLEIGGGDEVIIPPYTFIACPQAVLMNGAMPVFVDTNPETFQIDVDKIEDQITERTKAIMPVHIGGCPADMIRIMEIAEKNDLYVIEDACQAWLAEINNKQVGTFGDAGCYSFQNSKNLPIGEGGAIVSDHDEFMDKCFSYHNFGNPYGSVTGEPGSGTLRLGTKLRLSEYQAAIGLAMLKRFEEQTQLRNENAAYLKAQLEQIPGIIPHKLYSHVTRSAYHLFFFRFKTEEFHGLSKHQFRQALVAEGVPVSPGYGKLNKMPYLNDAFQSKNFQKMYPEEMLDIDRYNERNHCPENDRLCDEEAMWFTQNILISEKSDLDDIAESISKVQKHAGDIKKHLEA
jgi:perosamine synthetase